jgi:Protein of unknown function (DUF3126)
LRQQHRPARVAAAHPTDRRRRSGKPALMRIDGVFVGTVDREEDDGEVSYALTVPILAEDLADR